MWLLYGVGVGGEKLPSSPKGEGLSIRNAVSFGSRLSTQETQSCFLSSQVIQRESPNSSTHPGLACGPRGGEWLPHMHTTALQHRKPLEVNSKSVWTQGNLGTRERKMRKKEAGVTCANRRGPLEITWEQKMDFIPRGRLLFLKHRLSFFKKNSLMILYMETMFAPQHLPLPHQAFLRS